MKKIIEICCCSVDDAVEAYKGGANRIELNSALECGGLTPTVGALIEVKKRVDIPVITMIRPRTGGFCYTDAEFEQMKKDVEIMIENGADGIAFGILTPDNEIDIPRSKEIISLCEGKEVVFHRAIDVSKDIFEATKTLISLNVTRILTSGGKQRCLEGVDNLNKMLEIAKDNIQILACGSIRPTNMSEIMEKVPCNQFHMALMKECCDGTLDDNSVKFNGAPSETHYKMIDVEQVKAVTELVK